MSQRTVAASSILRGAVTATALAFLVACGTAGPAGSDATPGAVTAHGSIPASAVIASPINPSPSVAVTNANGAPLPNVRVTFLVAAGGGQVTGGSQLTDGSGVATVGKWTLGTTVGPQTMTASAGGKTVTFTVNATNSCTLTGALAAGTTVTGDLSASPCAMGDGTAAQSWSFAQSGQSNVSFQMHSTGAPTFDTVLLLHRNAFAAFAGIVGFNDDASTTTTDSRLDMILGPGNYVVSGVNYVPGETGAFSISAGGWDGDLANCSRVFVTTGITTTQRLDTNCTYPQTTQDADPVYLYLVQGQQVQIDMSSSAFDPALDLFGSSSTPLAQDDNGGGGTSSRIVFTAPQAGIYLIVATSRTLASVGAYTLAITSLSGAPTQAAQVSAAGGPVGGLRPMVQAPPFASLGKRSTRG